MSTENQNLELMQASGQTIDSDGKVKEMSDEQLKAAQSERAKASGILAKDGGSLTMPAKWRGKAEDANTAWGDWTNYSFPITDLAHANNAAARLAQNSKYSSAEKSKISKRIKAAQKKFQKQKASFITVSKDGLQFKDFKSVKADIMPMPMDDNDEDCDDDGDMPMYSMEQIDSMMSSMYGMMMDGLNDVYSAAINNHLNLTSQINDYVSAHAGTHLPPLHPGQVKAILTKAGIADDFNQPKPPMAPKPSQIYASTNEIKAKLNSVEYKVK